MEKRVVIHVGENGDISVYFDDGVTVFWVDEQVPNDRIYQMDHHPIPESMLDGEVGHSGDGSPANARAHAIVAQMEGRSHLSAVETKGGENG